VSIQINGAQFSTVLAAKADRNARIYSY